MPDNGCNKFIRLYAKGKEVEIFLSEEFCVIRASVAVFQKKKSPLTIPFSSLWRLIKLASDGNTMGGGLSLPRLAFVLGVLVEFPSLPVFAFCIEKSPSGAKKFVVATGHQF
jgi:hypothetical protein